MHVKSVVGTPFLVLSNSISDTAVLCATRILLPKDGGDLVPFGESRLPAATFFPYRKGIIFEPSETHANCWYFCPIV